MTHLSVGFLEKKKTLQVFTFPTCSSALGLSERIRSGTWEYVGMVCFLHQCDRGGEKKSVGSPCETTTYFAEPCRHPRKGSKLQTTHTTS